MLNGGQNQLVCIKAVGAEEKADLGQVEGVDLVVVEPVHLHDLHLAEVPLNADREVVHLSVLHAKAFPLKNKDKITQGTETGLTGCKRRGTQKHADRLQSPNAQGNPLIVLGNSNAINPEEVIAGGAEEGKGAVPGQVDHGGCSQDGGGGDQEFGRGAVG